MKKIFGYMVVAFMIVSIFAGCSRELKEFNEKKVEEPKVSMTTQAVDAAVDASNELIESINKLSYDYIVGEFEEVKDEITYWNEEVIDGQTVLTVESIYGEKAIAVFDLNGMLCDYTIA